MAKGFFKPVFLSILYSIMQDSILLLSGHQPGDLPGGPHVDPFLKQEAMIVLKCLCTISLLQHLISSFTITSSMSLCNYCKHPLHLCLTLPTDWSDRPKVSIPFPAQNHHLARDVCSNWLCCLADMAVKYSLMIAKAPITLIHILLLLQASNFGYHTGQKLL